MTTNSFGPPRSASTPSRVRAVLAVVALMVAGAATGCSDSTEGSPFKDFIGIWDIDFANSSFPLNCPEPNSSQNDEVNLWDRLVIEEGTLTDLIETSGVCPLKFNVKSGILIAETADPDPFTGQSAVCRLNASDPPGSIFADIHPSWELRIPRPEKGKAPRAQLLPLAQAPTLTFVTRDALGVETPDPSCTYLVRMELTKVAQF